MKDWRSYFPLAEIRKEQEIAIDAVLDSLFNKKKKFFIGEFPVGTGKSAISVTISKYLMDNYPIDNNKQSSFILTTQKILQEQYIQDFPYLSNIKSKENYLCVNKKGMITCDIGLKLNKFLKKNNSNYDCVYMQHRRKFELSQIGLTNMHFFLYNNAYSESKLPSRKILIIDECHNLEQVLIDFASLDFTKYFANDILKIKWPKITNIQYFMDWVIKDYYYKLASKSKEISGILNNKDESYFNSKSGSGILKLNTDVERKLGQVSQLIDAYTYDKHNFVMTHSPTYDRVEIKPLHAKKYAQKLVYSYADKILLMSGTVLDKSIFCNNNGIDEKDAEYLSIDMPFDKENRPVLVTGVGSMGRKNIDNTLPKMIESLKEILEEHKDQKGIIHCHTYKIMDFIRNNIKDSRLLFHSSDDREDVLEYHKKSKKSTVIVSPSFTEGIDLHGELSRFQVILKIPFPYLGDKYIQMKMKKVDGWYNWNTAKTIVQSGGRSIRDYDDWAITYILDSDFNFFFNRNRKLFPKWYIDSLNW